MNGQSNTADPSAIEIHCVLMHSNGLTDTACFGTKAQLVIADLAINSMFPPKRHRAYSPKNKSPEHSERSLNETDKKSGISGTTMSRFSLSQRFMRLQSR